jgi:putative sterol carrier protein
MGMADATAEFFDGLSRRGHEPLLGKLRATVRFDIVDGKRTDHWMLGLDDGDLAVSRSDGDADCVIQADKAAFDKVASGRTNAMAAYLRGALTLDGEPRLLVRLIRLFPDPVGTPEASGDRAVGKRRS